MTTPSPDQPLADIRVVAVEQAVAGPLCSRHLADLGADVIKIERPEGGDFARDYDTAVHGQSAYFVWLNHGKRSVTLDLASDPGRERLARLLDDADVLLHNLGPGAFARLGFPDATLDGHWPRLVRCAISGYGPDGPYHDRKAFDLLLQGESGLLATTGTPEAPAKVGISIADIAAGMYATTAILAALRQRGRTGLGVAIEISMLDCLAEWMAVPGPLRAVRWRCARTKRDAPRDDRPVRAVRLRGRPHRPGRAERRPMGAALPDRPGAPGAHR